MERRNTGRGRRLTKVGGNKGKGGRKPEVHRRGTERRDWGDKKKSEKGRTA